MSARSGEVTFEFLRQPTVLAQARSGRLLTTDPGDMQQMSFELPTRLNINGVELLEPEPVGTIIEAGLGRDRLRVTDSRVRPSTTVPAAVIGIAVLGTKAVEALQGIGETRYLGTTGWDLVFVSEPGDRVLTRSTLNNRTAVTSYPDLLAAFRRFREQVKALLLEEIPWIQSHPAWTIWFPEEDASGT